MFGLRRLVCSRAVSTTARLLSDAAVQPYGKVVPSHADQLNPIPGYEYIRTESYPVPGVEWGPPPPAKTGVHILTGETVKFPYFHKENACFNPDLTLTDMVEVIDADSEKGPIDMWLDGFQLPDLPKTAAQVYRIKGTAVGEEGPHWDFFYLYCHEFPAVSEAHHFWKAYGTIKTDYLPEEQFDAMWIHFFSNPMIDMYELRRGVNIIHDLDMIPEPKIVEAMFRCCRRLNDYPMTIRILEGIKDKIPKDPSIYQWVLQELGPCMEELGIATPDELGLHVAPEGKGPLPY